MRRYRRSFRADDGGGVLEGAQRELVIRRHLAWLNNRTLSSAIRADKRQAVTALGVWEAKRRGRQCGDF